ncbi:hypothetical protein BJ912DRAFT_255845 [Pholiota molesta]|nr:hypothetical protein BJ912DRAFT_255845 [Pholiota molesta]
MTSSTDPKPASLKLYVRLATQEDVEDIVDVIHRAFMHDPVLNYFGSVKKLLDETVDTKECSHRRIFLKFLLVACFLGGGRITVIVDPNPSSNIQTSQHGKIVAASFWLPPGKRLATWMVPTIVRAGALSVVKNWGLRGVLRIAIDYQGTCHSQLHRLFTRKGADMSVDDTWYLQMVGTDPEYQGRGLMSLLVRDAFTYDPQATFTLEATSAKSRDQYEHLGFEDCISIKFGQGKSDPQGLKAKGDNAAGLEIWGMTKWPAPM